MRSVLMVFMLAGLTECGDAQSADNAQSEDLCGAQVLQDRVGQPAQDFDFGSDARVFPEDSAVTLDFRPERLNVVTDDAGLIVKIECG